MLVAGCAGPLAESLERSLSWNPPGEVIAADVEEDLVTAVCMWRPDVVLVDSRHPDIARVARGRGVVLDGALHVQGDQGRRLLWGLRRRSQLPMRQRRAELLPAPAVDERLVEQLRGESHQVQALVLLLA